MKFDLFGHRVTIEKLLQIKEFDLDKFYSDIEGVDWMNFSGTYTVNREIILRMNNENRNEL
jgi:hypothetical protein